MHRLSDSESSDSDKGIRYKTESTRYKTNTSRVGDIRYSSRRERTRSPRSSHRDRSKHGSKECDRKKYRSSEEESCRNSKHKDKDNLKKKEKKYSKTRKSNEEKKIRISKNDSKSVEFSKKDYGIEANSEYIDRYSSVSLDSSQEPPEKACSDYKKLDIIGPTLSEHLTDERLNKSEDDSSIIGPTLPPHLKFAVPEKSPGSDNMKTIGPILPSPSRSEQPEISPNCDEDIKITSPRLKQEQSEEKELVEIVIGPVLPPHLRKELSEVSPSSPEVGSNIGPILPPSLLQNLVDPSNEESDDEVYGPLPAGATFSKAHIELEERALQMKIDKLEPKVDEPTREEWMTELPSAKATHFGLGPRQFRSKAGPDLSDRSSWTDTPKDKANKKLKKEDNKIDFKKEAELRAIKDRDKEQAAFAKKIKRNKESLIDIHTKKMKKKKEECGPSERRPFSRDVDLQVNRFDEAQKKAVLKKAQLLDTRFSSGESKFL